VLAGLSGVGKSSLLSAIHPGLDLRALSVGERGKNKNQGRHTTTAATLYPLDENSAVIDTPGIREFGLAGLRKKELADFYPEMDHFREECQYRDCTHQHEPGCAVQQAAIAGNLSELRYENYLKILEGLPG
jgi:ribosome biogenesis GTPase